MLGVMSLWTGILEIGRGAGLIERLSRTMRPVLRFLFRIFLRTVRRPDRFPLIYCQYIRAWLGSYPCGIKSYGRIKKEAEGSGHGGFAGDPVTATTDMCTFLILNISSLQLIPVNMIAYRSQYGSPSPAAITGPCLAATAASTIAAVIFCKIMGRKK